jgi:hypothetical protein
MKALRKFYPQTIFESYHGMASCTLIDIPFGITDVNKWVFDYAQKHPGKYELYDVYDGKVILALNTSGGY